jgi:uncharacterized protein with FMN-binding domain
MAATRMHRGLVALSASAIATVYLAGYLRTQTADATIAAAAAPTSAPQPIAVAAATLPPPPITRPTTASAAPPATATVAPRATATAPPTGNAAPTTAAYRDGTYDGQGTSRRGNVWVAVEIQAGRIANVTITRSSLQYPVRDIAGLPAQVVQRQTAQVDIVSRATFSSQAFRGAVTQALSKAS